MNKIKLLYIADIHYTGYGTASINLLKKFPVNKYEISYFGINQTNSNYINVFKNELPNINDITMVSTIEYDESELYDRKIRGYNDLMDVVERIKPDIVVSLNDIDILLAHFKIIRKSDYYVNNSNKIKLIGYIPIDCKDFPKGFFSELENNIDILMTLNNFSRREIEKTGFNKQIYVLEHAINSEYYYKMNKLECRNKLWGDKYNDYFIIINYNKAQIRKRIDITINATYELYKKYNKVLLICKESNNELIKEVEKFNDPKFKEQVIFINDMKYPSDLNILFNTADIGINTAMGEGWGLVSCEHALCEIPQLVGKNTSQPEIFEDSKYIMTETKSRDDAESNNLERSYAKIIIAKYIYNPVNPSLKLTQDIKLGEKNAFNLYVTNSDNIKHNGLIDNINMGNIPIHGIFTSFTNLYNFLGKFKELNKHKLIQILAHIDPLQELCEDYTIYEIPNYNTICYPKFVRDIFKIKVDIPTLDSTYKMLEYYYNLLPKKRNKIGRKQREMILNKYNLQKISNKFHTILDNIIL